MYQNIRKGSEHKRNEDPFRQFLFGKDSQSHEQNIIRNNNNTQQQNYFPQQEKNPLHWQNNDTPSALLNTASIEKYLNNLDVNLLYENIDLLMKTAQQFKPLYNELSPIIMKFLKKR